jgi:hypothetical protein
MFIELSFDLKKFKIDIEIEYDRIFKIKNLFNFRIII